jgi:alpha-L-arabinofuranosidase
LFTIALGGGVGANLHGGGDSTGYTPIADSNGTVVEARPEYYGALLVALAGQGNLLSTNISAGMLNVSAYTLQNAPTQLSVILVNKDQSQNLQFTANCPGAVSSTSMQVLTGPSLSSTTGVTIQGSSVNPDGSFSPKSAYALTVSENAFSGYVPTESAVLIVVNLS